MKLYLLKTGVTIALYLPIISAVVPNETRQEFKTIQQYANATQYSEAQQSIYQSAEENSYEDQIQDLKNFLNRFWIDDRAVETNPQNIVNQVITQIGITDKKNFVKRFSGFRTITGKKTTFDNALINDALNLILDRYNLNTKNINLKLKTDDWNNADLNEDLRFIRNFKNLSSLEISTVYKDKTSRTFNPDSLENIDWFSQLLFLNKISFIYLDDTNSGTANSLTQTLNKIDLGKLNFLNTSNIRTIDISHFIINDANKTNIMKFTLANDDFFKDSPFGLKVIMQNNQQASSISRSKYLIEDHSLAPLIVVKKNKAKNIPLVADLNLRSNFEKITINNKPIDFKVFNKKAFLYSKDGKDIRKKIAYRIGSNAYYTNDYKGASFSANQKIDIINNSKPFQYDEQSIQSLIANNNLSFKQLSEKNYDTYEKEKFVIDGVTYNPILISSNIIPNFDLTKIKFKVKDKNIFFSSIEEAKNDFRNFSDIESINSKSMNQNDGIERERKKASRSMFQNPTSINSKIVLQGKSYFTRIYNGKLIWDIPTSEIDFSKIRFQDTKGEIFQELTKKRAGNQGIKITEIISAAYNPPKSPKFNNILGDKFSQEVVIDDKKYKSMIYDNKSFFSAPIISKIRYQITRSSLKGVNKNKKEIVYYTSYTKFMEDLLSSGKDSIDFENYRYFRNSLSSIGQSLSIPVFEKRVFSKPVNIEEHFIFKTENGEPNFKSIFRDGQLIWKNEKGLDLSKISYVVERGLAGASFYITEEYFNKHKKEILQQNNNHVYSVENFYKTTKATKELDPKDFDQLKSIIDSPKGISIIGKYDLVQKLLDKKVFINKMDDSNNAVKEEYHFEIFNNKIALVNKEHKTFSGYIKYIGNNSFDKKSIFNSDQPLNLFTNDYVSQMWRNLINTNVSSINKFIDKTGNTTLKLDPKFNITNPQSQDQTIKIDGKIIHSINVFGKYYWENIYDINKVKYAIKNSKGQIEYFTELPKFQGQGIDGKLYSMQTNNIKISDPNLSNVVLAKKMIIEKSNVRLTIIITGAIIASSAILALMWKWITSKKRK